MHRPIPFLFLATLFLSFHSFAQVTPEQVIRYKISTIDKLADAEKSVDVYKISAPYGLPVLTANTLQEIRSKQILSVELAYTRFRRSQAFDQTKLNLNRLKNLKDILPEIFKSHHIDWILTEQTGAKDYKTGQTYFHGFIITTRKAEFTKKDRDAELAEMEKTIKADKEAAESKKISEVTFRERNTTPTRNNEGVKFYNVGPKFSSDPCELVADATEHIEYPMEAQLRKVTGRVEAQLTVNKNGDVQDIRITEGLGHGCDDAVKNYLKTMPKWTPAKDKQGNVNAYVTLSFWFALTPEQIPASEMPCDLIVVMPKDVVASIPLNTPNNVVSEIFDRNKSWNNVAVVCDVTGSMGPYMSDLMKWFRMNASRIKHFTFFNDGDMKPESLKSVGSTGGIYNIPATDYDGVEKEMYTAIRGGFGGDVPENDVEALLEAEKNAPFAERLVWIADNYATPRDLSLLPQVTKPVSIIICSNKGMVSVDFLNIARKLKASLHTMTSNLPNLSILKEGEKILIDEREYQLVGEKFVRIY